MMRGMLTQSESPGPGAEFQTSADLLSFIEASPTPFHAAASAAQRRMPRRRPAGIILAFMVFSATSSMRLGDAEMMSYGVIGVAALMVLMVLAFMGYQWYLIATTGQTLAKRWLGIKIVRVDGTPLGFVNGVILRSWVLGLLGNIPIVGPLVSLVNPLMIFGEERRCLHDQIAGTRVIVAPKA